MQGGLTIIPARGGSKRIPGKNTRVFEGKPLIHWTIEAALESPHTGLLVVSTDDPEILNYERHFPGVKFLKRPSQLAQDSTSTTDVIFHVAETLQFTSGVLTLLQPTSPLRTGAALIQAQNLFMSQKLKQLVSVRACREIPSHIFVESADGIIHPLLKDRVGMQSQSWKNTWVINGAIYVSDWDLFKEKRSFFTDQTRPFIMNEQQSVDIDTEDDWRRAEQFAKELKNEK